MTPKGGEIKRRVTIYSFLSEEGGEKKTRNGVPI